ncbi:MAG: Xaa-Pro aminopeptidase [Myxococcaceae bacterium]|nr:Xaa-Pro aminopeptidase [Myxococcaceae bacterium]
MPLLDKLTSLHRKENESLAQQPEHLEGFRRSQAVAYECVTAVERQLHEGMTEKQAAQCIHRELAARGVREYFHRPFAWFGERTAFTKFRHPLEFFPTNKKLELGMPVILDVAAIVDGHASDIGYACKLGDNKLHDQMLADLEPYRALIRDGVRAKKNLDVIYREVDALIARQGYQNRHQQYPFRVLAHRVNYVPVEARTEFRLAGFGPPALGYLFGRLAQTVRGVEHHSPFWNDQASSRHTAEPGLWAVEPHLGFRGVGVKWEELLVVTKDDAYWLDDDLPHVRRFDQQRADRPSAAAEVRA